MHKVNWTASDASGQKKIEYVWRNLGISKWFRVELYMELRGSKCEIWTQKCNLNVIFHFLFKKLGWEPFWQVGRDDHQFFLILYIP